MLHEKKHWQELYKGGLASIQVRYELLDKIYIIRDLKNYIVLQYEMTFVEIWDQFQVSLKKYLFYHLKV